VGTTERRTALLEQFDLGADFLLFGLGKRIPPTCELGTGSVSFKLTQYRELVGVFNFPHKSNIIPTEYSVKGMMSARAVF
jgi:hypothetical protein